MTLDQIGLLYGANKSDKDEVVGYLRSQGMSVKLVDKCGLVILADSTVAQAQRAFGATVHEFVGPDPVGNPMRYHANLNKPTLPAYLAGKVSDIIGLDDYSRPVRRTTSTLTPALQRGLYGAAQYYGTGNPAMYGQGQVVGISNWDGFSLSNTDLFISQYGLPVPVGGSHSNVQVVTIDGGTQHSTANGEGDLDIQMVLSTAPLCTLKVYDGNGGDLVNVLTTELNDSQVQIISESYGWNVSSATANSAHNIHVAMSAAGKTYMAASGDSGTKIEPYSYPDYDPEVLMVGGSIATVNSTTGARSSEKGWSGSGGGWSKKSFSWNVRPAFQNPANTPGMPAVTTSTNYRLVPDVAGHASGNSGAGAYYFYYSGALYTGSGTSFASPVFAGNMALARQRLGLSAGFGNFAPWIYANHSRSGLFYDITSGSNGRLPNNKRSTATVGWDYVTGWGAMSFSAFSYP